MFGKDNSSTPLNFGFKRISTAASESGQDAPHQRLAFDGSEQIEITEPGYVYIYISNENGTPVEVYFDDFKVTHVKSPIVQSNDYYPFGFSFNSYQRENSVENRYIYNQGSSEKKFLTERVFDLGLDVDLSKYRTYDYVTGRWWQVDPLADEDELTSLTPYNYSFNNPIRYNDPEGDCPWCLGALIGAATDYGLQVATNLAQGKDFGDAITDVDGKSILISAGAGAVSGGLSTLSKLKNASKLVKTVVDVTVDASASAANQYATEGKVDASSVIIDVVAGQTAGKKAGDLAEKSAKNSPTGKILTKDADRAKRVAGDNPRPAREQKAVNAQKKVDNYVQRRVVATSVASSNLASKVIKVVTGTDSQKKEEEKTNK